MNIYKSLNEITLYIDNHLEEKINYDDLAKIMGVNSYTMQRFFSMITNIPLSEYIRKRRLSCAAYDLISSDIKVIDVALKYNYDNATSFSRAFTSFHHVKPSKVKEIKTLKEFPRIVFDEDIELNTNIDYSIIELPRMILYGVGVNTNNKNIKEDAPKLFQEIDFKYKDKYGNIKYGMTSYKDVERRNVSSYHVLYDIKIEEFEKFEIPESKWLCFRINSQDSFSIQKMSQTFYKQFFTSSHYNLKDIPELEYYHDDITDFLVPID